MDGHVKACQLKLKPTFCQQRRKRMAVDDHAKAYQLKLKLTFRQQPRKKQGVDDHAKASPPVAMAPPTLLRPSPNLPHRTHPRRIQAVPTG